MNIAYTYPVIMYLVIALVFAQTLAIGWKEKLGCLFWLPTIVWCFLFEKQDEQ